MTSQPGSQTIVIQILSNLSRSKGNQAMKFGLVKEYNMRNIFVEKSYTKFGRTSPKPFSGKLKLTISLNQWSKVLYCLFLLYGKLRAIKMYWNEAADQLLSPHIKLFQKIKRGLELVSLPGFLHNFSRKIFPLLYFINCPNSIVWLSLLCEIFDIMCITIVTSWILKLNFKIKPFFLHNQKVVTKT